MTRSRATRLKSQHIRTRAQRNISVARGTQPRRSHPPNDQRSFGMKSGFLLHRAGRVFFCRDIGGPRAAPPRGEEEKKRSGRSPARRAGRRERSCFDDRWGPHPAPRHGECPPPPSGGVSPRPAPPRKNSQSFPAGDIPLPPQAAREYKKTASPLTMQPYNIRAYPTGHPQWSRR